MTTEPFDLRSALPAALAAQQDRAPAWRFVTGFAAYWDTPLTAADGMRAARVAEHEQRLGLTLPAALREAYVLFGERVDLTGSHDRLLAPEELYVLDGALVFREENQACARWGVPLADLAAGSPVRDNPPTVIRPDLADRSREQWEPWMPHLAGACVEMVLCEALFQEECDRSYLDAARLTPEAELRFEPLPAFGPGDRWFTGADLLIREVEDAFVCARARTPEALEALYEVLPGDWITS
jgi:hypothetical protein